jgi:hypothetical protein
MKSTINQLMFRIIYVTIGVIAMVETSKIFDGIHSRFDVNMFTYFTTLSNIACLIFMFFELIDTYKKVKAGKLEGGCEFLPSWKFALTITILITALVSDFLTQPIWDASTWTLPLIAKHMVLPAMFTIDWFFGYQHGKLKWKDLLKIFVLPYAYIIFALIYEAKTGIYRYFFFNVDKLGYAGVAIWCLVLTLFFAALGAIILKLDRIRGTLTTSTSHFSLFGNTIHKKERTNLK